MKYILRSLIFVHRWVGIALCVVFLFWFPSGIGMMYWGFPGVSADDRLDHSPKLDPAKIVMSPEEAAEKAGTQANPTQVRLNSFDGRPVYRISGGGGAGGRGGRGGGGARIIYADTGEEQTKVSTEMLDRIASAWAGKPLAEAKKVSVEETDQWTVAGQLSTLRPLYKYSWPDGQQVYLNGVTGEVVQYTTFAKRLAAHVSAIPHWLYYTPLRKRQPLWLEFMIWSSLIGTVGAMIGIVVAVLMYSPRKRYRLAGQATGVPYRGQKRWHWMLGMVFGVATVTWTFSGLMTLGPFPIVQRLTQPAERPGQRAGQQQSQPPQEAQQSGQEQPQQPPQPAAAAPGRGDGARADVRRDEIQPGSSQRAEVQQATGQGTDGQRSGGQRRGSGRGGRGRGGTGRGGVEAVGTQGNNPQTAGNREQREPAAGNTQSTGNENREARAETNSENAPTPGNRRAGGQVPRNRGEGTQTRGNSADSGQSTANRGGGAPRDGAAPGSAQIAADQGGSGQRAGNQAGGREGGGARGGGQQGIAGALRGRVRMTDFASIHPRDLLARVPNLEVKELEWTSFANAPLFNANLGGGKSQLLSLDGAPVNGFDVKQVIDIVNGAVPDPKTIEIKIIDQYDLYYLDRTRQRPLPVLLVLMNDEAKTRYYIDPKSARVVTTYSNRNWVNRWLYTGLHSLNFPFLYNHRPLWDIVVITFMLGGTSLCVTSLVLAWRTLGRKLKRVAANDLLPRES